MNSATNNIQTKLRKLFSLKNIFMFVTPVSIAILIVMLLNLSQTVEHLSHSLIQRTTNETVREMHEFFEPVEKNLRIARDWGTAKQVDSLNPQILNLRFVPVLQNNRQISSMLLANTQGHEYMLMRDALSWMNRKVVTQADTLCVHRMRWHYTEEMKATLDSEWIDRKHYDPRQRPWFQAGIAALSDTSIAWTKPYVFFTTKEPGITAAMRWKSSTNDSAVIAFDVLFTDLSQFTTKLPITPNGKAFILTDDNRMLGLPADNRFQNPDSMKRYVLAQYTDLQLTSLNSAIETWKQNGSQKTPFVFKVDKHKWWAGFYPVKLGENNIFFVGVMVPEDDFMAEVNRTRIIIIAGFGLVVILTLLVIRGYSQKQKAYQLLEKQNKQILEQKEEIESQRDEIVKQRDHIEHQSNEITSSIRYAKRIQSAVLPPQQLINQILPQSGILYRPRDIVSGDFYWIHANNNIKMWAAADCTGHGVPGAFMSMIGYKALDQAVKEYSLLLPNQILDKLCEILADTFRQTSQQHGNETIKDGMDISLCLYDESQHKLFFSAANNPVYIIRKTGNKLICNNSALEPSVENEKFALYEIKADKQPIGQYSERKPFTLNTIEISSNDMVYTFSDGFADQFGGEKGKKFMYKTFKELLASIQTENPQQQIALLDSAFTNWIQGYEQVDDVLIFGVKI